MLNPCGPTDFTQTTVTTFGALLPNTLFYFNGGTYNANGTVSLVPGQIVESRSAGYTQPATDTARSTINTNQIGLNGNNSLVNIILSGTTNFNGKVVAAGLNNVITGSQIGTSGFPQSIGVRNTGGSLRIDNTVVSSTSSIGLFLEGGSTSVENSTINILGNIPTGIDSSNGARVTLNNVRIQGTGTFIAGISATSSNVNATNTAISISTTSASGIASGLQTSNSGTIQFAGGSISVDQGIIVSDQTIIRIRNGNNIVIDGLTVCQVNFSIVPC